MEIIRKLETWILRNLEILEILETLESNLTYEF